MKKETDWIPCQIVAAYDTGAIYRRQGGTQDKVGTRSLILGHPSESFLTQHAAATGFTRNRHRLRAKADAGRKTDGDPKTPKR